MGSHKSVILGSPTPSGGSGPSSTQFPSSLGQKTMANSFPVVIASDQTVIPVSDNGNSITVDSPQFPASLGQTTKSASLPVTLASDTGDLTIKQGSPAKTDNTTYITTGNMSADVDGAAITVGPEGRLLFQLSWSNTGSPIGTFVVQGLMPDGSTYDDIPLSSAAFLRHPNADTNTSVGYLIDVQIFISVRLKYRRTSGGTANTTLVVRTRTM